MGGSFKGTGLSAIDGTRIPERRTGMSSRHDSQLEDRTKSVPLPAPVNIPSLWFRTIAGGHTSRGPLDLRPRALLHRRAVPRSWGDVEALSQAQAAYLGWPLWY